MAITAWLPDQTHYQTVSNTNTPLEVVTIFEHCARTELSACADLSLVDNGTVVSPNAGPIFGVGYTYTSITGACVTAPCGYGLDAAAVQAHEIQRLLPDECEVWAIDADAVRVRPGARLVDGVEAIAAVLHNISKAPEHLVRQVR